MNSPRAFGPLRSASRLCVALALGGWLLGSGEMSAHNLTGDPAHPHYDRSVKPPEAVAPAYVLAQASRAAPRVSPAPAEPAQAAAFLAFAPRVSVRWDERFLYVESGGLPAHGMMVGITAWQQQVPLPQAYTGANAWRIPLAPVPAAAPVSIRGRFLRGAIALAANGIPIFNPQNNRGEVSQDIGELDEWGGHCGRADDYHYHAAPLHLQKVLGPALPIAFALDGYAIYGLTEPDGSTPQKLDAFNGHATAALGYHYHGSTRYPFVNGGFHGEIVEREGQVDPQPRAQSVRRDQPPLRGAKITGFQTADDERSFSLQYQLGGRTSSVNYAAAAGGAWKFSFVSADGTTREETYRPGDRPPGGGGGRLGAGSGPLRDGGPSERRGPPAGERRAESRPPAPEKAAPDVPEVPDPAPTLAGFTLRSPAVGADGLLPVEFTGDGESATPPLAWHGAPAGTKAFAVMMHHLDLEGRTKWYWTLYNLPADLTELPRNVRGVGTLGNNSVNRRVGYAPPHSKGPGAKTYVLTVYALGTPLQIATPPERTDRATLLTAMKGVALARAELKVTYTRSGGAADNPSQLHPSP